MHFEELLKKLKDKGLSTKSLEMAPPEKQSHILKQFNVGEKKLVIIDGRALSVMQRVVVRLTWELTPTLNQKLVEFERHIRKNKKVVKLVDLDGIGKKIRRNEHPLKAAERCLKEKLDFNFTIGLDYCYFLDSLSPDTSLLPSGLVITRCHFVSCSMPPSLYNPNGYEREFEKHKAFFRWIPLPKAGIFDYHATD